MNKLRGKRLLVLGGNAWKEEIQRYACENGIVIISTGDNPNAAINSIANEYYCENSTDALAMKALIREKSIDGVYMGANESVIGAACRYLKDLNMPCYCTPEQWDFFQHKGNFKNLCNQFELPTVPKFDISIHCADEEFEKIPYPVISKPADGSGSNGFSVCNNVDELKVGLMRASGESPSGSVLVERFVPNDGVVVFYTFCDGEIFFSGLEDKYTVKFEKQGTYVIGAGIFKSELTSAFRRLFDSKLKAMFDSVGIEQGTIWIEVFHDDDSYYFNEAGFRYGGTVSIYPVNYYYGINQVASDIYFALTGTGKIDGMPSLIDHGVSKNERYCIYPLYLNAGIIKSIEGLEELKKKSNIVTIPVSRGVGVAITDSGSFSQSFALVHFVFNSTLEFEETVNLIHSTIQVKDMDGQEMLKKMLNMSVIKNDRK